MSRVLATVTLSSLLAALASCNEPAERVAEPSSGAIRLVDATEGTGVDVIQLGGGKSVDYVIDSVGAGGAWLDYDGDGDADLYLAQGAALPEPRRGPPDVLLRNDGDDDGDGWPEFSDVTAAANLGDTLWSFGAAVADYDGDGDPDLYLTNWGPNRLYRNDGDGTFTEIAEAAGVADGRWGVSAAWSDVDRDGDLDLYVANYVEFDFDRYPARGEPGLGGGPPCTWRDVEVFCGPRGLEAAHDVFYRNDGDDDGDGIPTFTDATVSSGLLTGEPYYGLAVLFFDTDDDGDDDLYVANDSVANLYFVNQGDGTFVENSVISGLAFNEQGHEQAGMGLAAGDYDGDGLFDLAVTNFSHDHDTLYHNDGNGFFTDASFSTGLGGPTYLTLAWGIVFADLDQDGLEDLFIAHGHVYPQVAERDMGVSFDQRDSVFRAVGDGRFEEVTDRAGPGLAAARGSRAVLPVDLDGDGDLDLAVTHLNDTPALLRNDGATGHWLQVWLEGSQSNREGIGARLTAHAGGRRQIRQVTRSASFAGSTLPVAHFGLGPHRIVDQLEVRWPSGATTVHRRIEADRLLFVRESED